MCDLTKILAENQNDMQKLKASTSKTLNNLQDVEGIDSEAENVLSTTSSTPIKTETTTQKNNPITSRNMATGVLIDSTNLLTPKNRYNNARRANKKERPTTSSLLYAPQPQTYQTNDTLPMPKALTASFRL